MRGLQAAGGKALTGSAHPPGRQAPRRVLVLLGVAAFVYLADAISKIVVVATLTHPVRLLGGLVTLVLLRNSGAAFSIGTSMTVVFTLIAVGVIVFILRTSRRLRSLPWAVTLGLLLGGATGNLTDRLLRSPGVFRGDVVDWIQLPHWPVFNVADSAIVCGGALAVLLAARGIRLDGARDGDAGSANRVAEDRSNANGAADGTPAEDAGDGKPGRTGGQDGRSADGQGVDGRGVDGRGVDGPRADEWGPARRGANGQGGESAVGDEGEAAGAGSPSGDLRAGTDLT